MAEVQFSLEGYERGLELIDEALVRNPEALRHRMVKAALYVGLGREADAEWEIEEVLLLQPEIRLSDVEFIWPYRDRETADRLLEFLRRAGLPE